MKTYVVTCLAVVTFAAMLLAGGCVSKEELDKALAANRRANEELEKTQTALRQLRGESEKLMGELDARQKALDAKNQELGILQAAKAQLQEAFDKLNDAYKKLAGQPPVVIVDAVLPPELDKALKAFAAANPDLVTYDPRHGMVKFKSDLTFAPGSDVVQQSAIEALAKLVDILSSPAAARFNVYIAGHTDDIPIAKPETRHRHPTNWYLSVHRAVAVLAEMGKVGLAGQRMGAMGFGEFHPVAPNAPGNKGNVLNRRVEIWIVPPDRFLTGPTVTEVPPPAAEATEK